jgi:hypothetical protein
MDNENDYAKRSFANAPAKYEMPVLRFLMGALSWWP